MESLSKLELTGVRSRPLVCVIVLNYCSADDTIDCLELLKANEFKDTSVIAIDNASPDDSAEFIERNFSFGEFIRLLENTGYAGGNNEGIKRALKAGAEYVLILNPDVRVPVDALSDYINVMEADPTIGALNPIQVESDGSTIDHKFAKTILKPMGCSASRMEELDLPEVFEAKELLGAAILLPRRTLETVGGFDPIVFCL